MAKKIIPILILATLLMGCTSAGQYLSTKKKGPLMGIVYDDGGSPLQNAVITLNGDKSVKTGIDGRFFFPKRGFGTYDITATHKDFITINNSIEFVDGQDVVYLRLTSWSSFLNQQEKLILDKDYEEAIRFFGQAQEGGEEFILDEAWFMQAIALWKTEQLTEALDTLDHMKQSTPEVEELRAKLEEESLDFSPDTE